jgi:hypothetical protein
VWLNHTYRREQLLDTSSHAHPAKKGLDLIRGGGPLVQSLGNNFMHRFKHLGHKTKHANVMYCQLPAAVPLSPSSQRHP